MLTREKFYAPETETGAGESEEVIETPDTGAEEVVEAGGNEPQEKEPAKKLTIRQQLEKNFEADRKGTEATSAKQTTKGKAYTSRARQEAIVDSEAGAEAPPEEKPQTTPPEAFSKEAKAEWANVPSNVQAAILKREQDVAKGVQELKSKYAELDQAIAPHMDAIRQNGHTPAAAVHQLFSWFQALAHNPQVAFPALAKSFGHDISAFIPQQQQPAGDPPAELTPEQKAFQALQDRLAAMEDAFTNQLNNVQQTFASQSQQRTNEVLENWAKGKKHFDKVRQSMAQLLASGAVPLNNGQVDLDAAYERAIWMDSEIRAELMAEIDADKVAKAAAKVKAEKAAQAAQAEKARKAAVGVGGGAPGAQATQTQKPGARKSVRESILEARDQLQN